MTFSVCGNSYIDPGVHTCVDGECDCGKYGLQHTDATLTQNKALCEALTIYSHYTKRIYNVD